MGYVKTSVLAALLASLTLPAAAQNCTDINTTDFKKTVLAQNLESPMKMKIADDGRIFFIERTGHVMLLKPGSTTPTEMLALAVAGNSNNEDGVLGIALDPKFNSNNWIYIYYTLATPMGYRVSRFTLAGDQLDKASEKILLTVPHAFTKYGELIIHGAGAMAFDPAGNLLIASGDLMITQGGHAVPVNDGTQNFDAQKTSANTNNLLGKILRITPKDDGTYSIPSGNLFAAGTAQTKPEIYAMGVRNPFTMTIDPKTGWAYSGEVGPDGSGTPIASQDEINQIKQAGNFGWPYLTGDNQAYNDMAGKKYDAANLVNNSKNNTGMTTLPAGTKSLFWFSNSASWPITGVTPNSGNRCIKVGGFYRFNPAGSNSKRLPPAMENGFFMANHNNSETLRFVKLNEDGGIASIKPVMTGMARPISFEVGPDGTLYTMEWGSDAGHWFNGKDGKLSKIEYTGTCSTTKLAPRFVGQKSDVRELRSMAPGLDLAFPLWSTHAELYDLQGVKRADVRRGLGEKASAPAPSGLAAGLMYVRFIAD